MQGGSRKKQLLTVNPVNPLVFLFSSLSLFFSLSFSFPILSFSFPSLIISIFFKPVFLQFLERMLGGLLKKQYFCGKLRNDSENCMAQF